LIVAEIAANVELPDGGSSWQKLRHGDLGEFPSLTFSSDSTLPRNESGDPISPRINFFDDSDDESESQRKEGPIRRVGELVTPPAFMVDPEHGQALDQVVQRMIHKYSKERPTIDQVYQLEGVQWVQKRRRAGAIIYEGYWGPADDVLNHALQASQDVDIDMTDV
jgi:mitosis inhibitor protein kinase SWE1